MEPISKCGRTEASLSLPTAIMLRICRALGVLTAAMLAGCVSYSPKPLVAEATQAQFENRGLADEGLVRFLTVHGATAAEWDVSRLTLAALYYSPTLDVARAKLRESEAGIEAAQARPNPTFSFAPTYNQETPSGNTPWILGYALDLPIETAHKRTYRVREAGHRAEVARLRLAESAWLVRSAVRRALLDLEAAEATETLWRAQTPLLGDAARLVDAQVGAGEVSPLLAAQARIALNRAELARRESERTVVVARSQLAQAVGVPASAFASVRLSYRGLLDGSAQLDERQARLWAAQNRADLLAELAGYAAAEAALQTEIARQYPDIAIKPGYSLDQGAGKWSLGVGLSLPLLNQNQGPIAVATARREVAAAQFLAVQARVLAEVDRASADYRAAAGDLETLAVLRVSAERQARTVKAQQAAGETSRLELVRAQIELADLARLEVDARTRVGRAISALEDAVQRPVAWPEAALRETPRTTSN